MRSLIYYSLSASTDTVTERTMIRAIIVLIMPIACSTTSLYWKIPKHNTANKIDGIAALAMASLRDTQEHPEPLEILAIY